MTSFVQRVTDKRVNPLPEQRDPQSDSSRLPVTVLKKPLKIEQLYQTVKILGNNAEAGLEQQSSRLLVGL
jgi:hypothetical protein